MAQLAPAPAAVGVARPSVALPAGKSIKAQSLDAPDSGIRAPLAALRNLLAANADTGVPLQRAAASLVPLRDAVNAVDRYAMMQDSGTPQLRQQNSRSATLATDTLTFAQQAMAAVPSNCAVHAAPVAVVGTYASTYNCLVSNAGRVIGRLTGTVRVGPASMAFEDVRYESIPASSVWWLLNGGVTVAAAGISGTLVLLSGYSLPVAGSQSTTLVLDLARKSSNCEEYDSGSLSWVYELSVPPSPVARGSAVFTYTGCGQFQVVNK